MTPNESGWLCDQPWVPRTRSRSSETTSGAVAIHFFMGPPPISVDIEIHPVKQGPSQIAFILKDRRLGGIRETKLCGATRECQVCHEHRARLTFPSSPPGVSEAGVDRPAATPYERRQKYEGTQAPLSISGGIMP